LGLKEIVSRVWIFSRSLCPRENTGLGPQFASEIREKLLRTNLLKTNKLRENEQSRKASLNFCAKKQRIARKIVCAQNLATKTCAKTGRWHKSQFFEWQKSWK
jgi:hypothetical protein